MGKSLLTTCYRIRKALTPGLGCTALLGPLVSDDVEDVLELNTLLLSVIKLLAVVLMTVELDPKMLVNKTIVSASRART